ncbi:MAG: glycerophosphodiester phosphodiesterase family protein [Methylovirgula sp.]
MVRDRPALNAWLTARPIAHRGLHGKGSVENSIAAAVAAIAKGYAIECDVQCTKDGEAVVFHDFALDRLTGASGDIGAFPAATITRIVYRDGLGTIPTLRDFLTTVGGRVPVFVEIKSRLDTDTRLVAPLAELVAAYAGPLALQSFHPQVLAECRRRRVACPLGLVASAEGGQTPFAGLARIESIAADFLAWRAEDLPHVVARICRSRMPVLAWTVRDEAARAAALRCADQIIFEGFEPRLVAEAEC